MIIDERMSAFIDSLDSGNPAWLNEIEKYALDTQVPIIRRSMQSLLKFLLRFTKPKSILEVGTAIGFSERIGRYLRCDLHGCGQGAIYQFPAGYSETSVSGRSTDLG